MCGCRRRSSNESASASRRRVSPAERAAAAVIEVGDADGVELYNEGRRAKKNVVLLVYGSEDHGLRQKANQIDYHHRIGVTYLDKEKATRKSGS
jgi:hypothetical protein